MMMAVSVVKEEKALLLRLTCHQARIVKMALSAIVAA